MYEKTCILIATYNASQWLETCLGPYRDRLPESWKLLVVDNASTDDTVHKVRQLCPDAVVVENSKNLGFGRANNIGLERALADGADHVLLLNQDADISVESIRELCRLQREFPEYYIISPVHLDATGRNLDYAFARACLPQSCANFVRDALYGVLEPLYPATQGNAAVWLLSRECLNTIGGFSPVFYHYGEDNNYLSRVLFHGAKCGIAPHIFARHHRSQSMRKKKKPLSSAYTDRIIDYSDPGLPEPSRLRVNASAVIHAVRLAVKGEKQLASFILQHHAGLQNNALLAARQQSMHKGPSFLDVKNTPPQG